MDAEGLCDGLAMIAAGIDIVHRTDWTAMAIRDRLATMDTLETDQRLTLAVNNAIAATIADEPIATLGDVPKKLIADVLRITPAEAATRLTHAELVRERSTLTGEPLPPHLPATAQAWNKGLLDAAHLAEIITFFDEIPADTPPDVQETSERFLAEKATQLRPDQLKKVAKKLAQTINPDGNFSDKDRTRKSGFHWEAQRADGMSKGVLWATPQLRAHIDAFFATYAAYGMSMPDHDQPDDPDTVVDGDQPDTTADGDQPDTEEPADDETSGEDDEAVPDDELPDTEVNGDQPAADHDQLDSAVNGDQPAADEPAQPDDADNADNADNADDADDKAADAADDAADAEPPSPTPKPAVTDFRTPSQRRHDALNHWMRSVLGNPALGTHHGLPLTLVVTTTLAELEAGAGHAITATGTMIPMDELIGMAASSYRYLQIFGSDADRRTLDFYRARRCANGDQWLALFGRDRGCTRPHCDKSAEDSQAHHSPDYATGGQTNVDLMSLACYQDHPQVGPHAWKTHMRNGNTEWTPRATTPETPQPPTTSTTQNATYANSKPTATTTQTTRVNPEPTLC